MRLLLDTHIAIWAVSDKERLSTQACALIAADTNDIYVSAVSIGEIAIKHALGNRDEPLPFSATDAIDLFSQAGFDIVPLERIPGGQIRVGDSRFARFLIQALCWLEEAAMDDEAFVDGCSRAAARGC